MFWMLDCVSEEWRVGECVGLTSLEEEIAGREVTRHWRPIECTYIRLTEGGSWNDHRRNTNAPLLDYTQYTKYLTPILFPLPLT